MPTTTTTFLFTDIAGSTRLWAEHRDAMGAALARHDALLRAAVEEHGGSVFKTVGDAVCAAFPAPLGALAAALAGQRALAAEDWSAFAPDLPPLTVRMAIHTGVAEPRDGDWFGQPLNRVARLLAIGHGGQVLVSRATEELVADQLPGEVALRDLGEHRLKDLARPERVFQVLAPDLPADFPALRSLDTQPNNLPAQLTSFVGREADLALLGELLGQHRLVTLTGLGGTGKTRLAVQAAADAAERFPDGAWFVDLAPVIDPALVADAVARAVALREAPGRPVLDTLADHLARWRALLVLDNCEQVVAAAAETVERLLSAAPGLVILATSREALGAAGEHVLPLAPLALPADDHADPATVARYDAVRLFVERATAVQPAFMVTADNAPAIAQICQRLDGIPLAIELAAARVPVLDVGQIAARLDERFRLLTGGRRTAVPRQQTLRGALDWSHDLLTPAEQALFRRLAVFRGGWTLGGAETVCADDEATAPDLGLPAEAAIIESWEVLDLLARLVDKSLVQAIERPGERRFLFLETVREYAGGRLTASGEGDRIRHRHLAYFADQMAAIEAAALVEDPGPRYVRLAADHGNLRAAMDWGLSQPAEQVTMMCLAAALGRYCETAGHITEGLRWLRAAVACAGGDRTWETGRTLYWASALALYAGDLTAGEDLLQRAGAVFEAVGDRLGQAWYYQSTGALAQRRGHPEVAGPAFSRSLELKRAHSTPTDQAMTMIALGEVDRARNELGAALEWFDLATEMLSGNDSVMLWQLYVRFNLALTHVQLGRWPLAAKQVRMAAEVAGAVPSALMAFLAACAAVVLASAMGRDSDAARLQGYARAQQSSSGYVPEPHDQAQIDAAEAAARDRLGAEAWAEGVAAGERMSAPEVAALVDAVCAASEDQV